MKNKQVVYAVPSKQRLYAIPNKQVLCAIPLALVLFACGGNTQPPPAGTSVVAGLVTDLGTGAKLEGVAVGLVGTSKSTTTDAKGEFVFADLVAGTTNFSLNKNGYALGYASAKAGATPETVLVSLKREGNQQNYNPNQSKTLSQRTEAGPYAVIFTPNSLDSSDANLRVSITPIDPTKEADALPGQLATGGASPVPLAAVTFAEFTILDSAGKKVNLKAGANAIVELPIPAKLRTQYPLGAKIHCYAYNPETGQWEDFVEGTVATSSVDGKTPVLRAQIRHFSWYGGAPQVKDQACVSVQVISRVTGKPLAGAKVVARPGLSATTDANGNAFVTVSNNANVSFTATKTYQDTFVDDQGNLVPKKGAKTIDFGDVDEPLYVPKLGPCSGGGARLAPQGTPVKGEVGNPVQIVTGLAPDAVYDVMGVLSKTGVSVFVQNGIPGSNGELTNPEPTTGAKITLGDGTTTTVLLEAAPGLYSLPSGVALTPGQSYSIGIDGDGNGTQDGSGEATVVGDIVWDGFVNNGSYPASGFTAKWKDSASSSVNYSALYQLMLMPTGSNSTVFGIYMGSELFAQPTTIDLANPAAGFGTTPLGPGVYDANVMAFSGGFQGGGLATGITVSKNITGKGVRGQLMSFNAAPQIRITLR